MSIPIHLVFEPICLRSDLCKSVEKGGGLYCPSRLPLKLHLARKIKRLLVKNKHSHIDRDF